MSKDKCEAKVEQILLWYDRPEILLLRIGRSEFVIAVSSGEENCDEDQYVGASMNLAFLAEYQEGKFDLRYALAHANLRRYWTFSLESNQQTVCLTKVKKSSDCVFESLPDTGFFSREHHPIKVAQHLVPDTVERFDIDGSWELGEFSQFYGQIEDIYYIFTDIRKYCHPNSSEKTKAAISRAFDRPWRGGGSYVAYYDKIANDNARESKLRVSGIKYNSPGYVSVFAKKRPFDDIIGLLQSYAHNMPEMRKAHRQLRIFMSANKLLRRDAKNTAPSKVTLEVDRLASNLSSYMANVKYAVFVDMSENNKIVAAKVLLSVFRRMERLYQYFEEGRVKYQDLETDPMTDLNR